MYYDGFLGLIAFVSVERYHCYVQYSTLISCHECRKISLLCTVQYIENMADISIEVNEINVVSVERYHCYVQYSTLRIWQILVLK